MEHVCLRCRLQLLASSRPRRLPATATRAFFTTSAGEAHSQNEPGNQPDKVQSDASVLRQSRKPAPVTLASRPQRGSRDGSSSLAMFKSIVSKDAEPLPADTLPSASDNMALVRDVAKIQTMVFREGAAVADAYTFFEQTVYPQITAADGVVPRIVKEQLGTVLFPRLLAEKMNDLTSDAFPSVYRITQLLVQLDILRPVLWGNLVVHLVDAIWRLSTTTSDYASIQSSETAMALRDSLLQDLVGAWGAFWSQTDQASAAPESLDGTANGNGDIQTDAPVVDAEATQKTQLPGKRSFQHVFGEKFSERYHGSLLRPSWAALATYALLTETKIHNSALQEKAYPFLEAMGGLLTGSRLPNPKGQNNNALFEGCPEVLGLKLAQFLAKSRKSNVAERKPVKLEPRSEADIIHKEIGRAIKTRNLKALNAAWAKFWGKGPGTDTTRLEQLRSMGDLFDYFIFAYMSMRQTQLSLTLWSSMAEHQITPTIKTWTSMMQGCTKANNPAGIKAVWDRLVASGTQLDTPAWTARISGLILSGDLEGGIAALEEMGRVWRDRDRPENTLIAVKPSIEPINAALSWLLRLDRMSTIQNLLGWAARQGISPDTYTFNTMLRPLVRAGRNAEVRNVLDMMRAHDIQADGATFTILLDGALADISSKTTEEQVEVVTRLIRDVESAGVEVNMHIYGKMVYILLEECGDGAAVNAVLAHIWGRGLELSSHIYTMLAEHYFSRSPPDADAVTTLIHNRRLHSHKGIDRVFWERVIKGYCQVGETQLAMEVFERLVGNGSTITFSTLFEFLQTLVGEGRVEMAGRVVAAAVEFREAEDEVVPGGGSGNGKTRRYWRHRFWHLADERGLLDGGLRERFREALTSV
ncbi:hypothetical protein QBC47DRAFT_76613 [Echria macrotheca]|uniref:Pentatricopeptide repeat-containing protein n=1 Tax=Echria macrotheca TaxID=438768 RepID=A0AAJ0B547_9PEZI|nr:hypothetical protein QBC47DRAFT_76613 [Echria macrotheca]